MELGTTGSKSKGDYDFVMEVLLKSIGTAQVPSFWVKSTLPVRKILALFGRPPEEEDDGVMEKQATGSPKKKNLVVSSQENEDVEDESM